MSFQSLLDSNVSIKRRGGTTDSLGGGGSITWNLIYSNVPCRFETLSHREAVFAYDKKTVYPDYYVYLEYRSGIKEGDCVFKGGRKFEIKLIEDWSEQGKYMKLTVAELGRGE